jgi:lipopolysaccharide biosynthesis glycosyltransferase
VATYYRLELPSLLPEVSKCLYLDADIIATGDVSEIFNTDISEYFVAGVKAAGYHYPEAAGARHANNLGIPSIDHYINVGVSLMNLDKIRDAGLENTFPALIAKNFPSHDQDILNVAFYNAIKILPPKYNVMTKYHPQSVGVYYESKLLSHCFTESEWIQATSEPTIIHYADKIKPWSDLSSDYSEVWWQYFYKCFPNDMAAELSQTLLLDSIPAYKSAREEAQNNSVLVKQLGKSAKKLEKENLKLQKRLSAIETSLTYRLARGFAFVPRTVKKLLRKIKRL